MYILIFDYKPLLVWRIGTVLKKVKKMGDISNKNFELTDSAKLKMSLLDDLRNNPNKKQIIKLKGNSR